MVVCHELCLDEFDAGIAQGAHDGWRCSGLKVWLEGSGNGRFFNVDEGTCSFA